MSAELFDQMLHLNILREALSSSQAYSWLWSFQLKAQIDLSVRLYQFELVDACSTVVRIRPGGHYTVPQAKLLLSLKV